ncbi:bifunctional metallophosphatase/5'-nucleotidase [Bacillus sp. UMB0899]|uniref:bifunctional metallophosphatase/5'-nucleotidase n=1 Tax=Metabacillus schmidteae TaxID=2730405 RepID=UPI000C804309|nr:5'-nucleotidase C-terminal domain-containing protein [Metabacillus schmidteae]PMC40783.1 bifunctional metallophosphatase/5'-nucleotidase [Bacillus sp. UMB0899]
MYSLHVKKVLLLLLFVLFIVGGSVYAATSIDHDSTDSLQVQLLGVNDLHGHLDTYDQFKGKKVGGADYLAAYLNKYRQENEHTLIIHAGDMIGGSPPISSLLQDEPTMEYLDLLQFDVGTIGNHELDEGIDEMKRLLSGGSHPITGYFPGSETPYISANIIDKKTNRHVFPPYLIKEIDGIKIGFIGVVTTKTNLYVLPENLDSIKITDEVKAINKAADDLKKQGVKSIVVLGHISSKSNSDGTNPDEDLAKMAPDIDDEVDILFGAHNHQYTNTVVDNKLIVQAYSYGKAFSHINIGIDKNSKDIIHKKANIILTDHERIKPDPDAIELIHKYKEKTDTYVNQVVGTLPDAVSKRKNKDGFSPLGYMIADSYKASMNTDFAFVHQGGLRESLNKGTVKMEDLLTVLPFGHKLVSTSITGEQIKKVLEQQWRLNEKENILQVSGLSYTYVKQAPIGNKIKSLKETNGDIIDPDKTYTVAITDYLSFGGDGFTSFEEGKAIGEGPLDVEAFAELIKGQRTAK